MIARINGEIVEVADGSVVVDVLGIGYEVLVSKSFIPAIGERINLYIRTISRDDVPVLYGFASRDDRRTFDQLRTVQGVGSQLALGIIGQLGSTGVAEAVSTSDKAVFKAVSGVGDRLASRLVLEMKRFIENESDYVNIEASIAGKSVKRDIAEALSSMGFKDSEISSALVSLPEDLDDPSEGLRVALKALKS